MKKDLISVLLPVYNCERWIKRAIESMLNQTHKELQIVVVNDGSTDRTEEIVKSIQDIRIDYYKIENSGISIASNFGLSKAESNYIAKLDADDFSVPERIEVQYDFIKKNSEYGLIGSNYLIINDQDRTIAKVKYPEKNKNIIEQLPRKNCIAHPTVLYCKDLIFEIGGYSPEFLIAHDWDIYLKLIYKTKFYNIQKYLTIIRKHPGGISNKQVIVDNESEKLVLGYSGKIINNSKDTFEIAKANFNIGYFFYYLDKDKESIKYLIKARKFKPRNIQYFRYFVMLKYFKGIIKFARKSKINKLFNLFRKLDKNNKIFRSKY